MTFFSGIDIKPDADDRRDRVGGRPGAQDDSGHRLNHSFNPERLIGSGGMPEFPLIHCMFAGNGGGAAVRSGKL